MITRKTLWIAMLAFSMVPVALVAQDQGTETLPSSAGGFRRPRESPEPINTDSDRDIPPAPADDPPTEDLPADTLPADFPSERGQIYRSFDISRYTSLPHTSTEPQNALVEWIFRRTGSSAWHGDAIAVLSASRAQLRVYHNPETMTQVEEVVERFLDAQPSDYIKVRVRLVTAIDTRWRYAVASKLIPIATGEQGQQVWTLSLEDSTMVRTQMQVYQGFKILLDQDVSIINGQTLSILKELDVEYVAGPQRDSAVGLGVQPGLSKLKEGVVLRLSPLLTYEGDSLDLAVDLRANTARKLHPTKILTTREIGPVDMTIDVPEITQTRVNQTLTGLKLNQSVLITGGIHPGILQSKTGFMNLRLPGTTPTKTELLVFLDFEASGAPSARVAREDREKDSP